MMKLHWSWVLILLLPILASAQISPMDSITIDQDSILIRKNEYYCKGEAIKVNELLKKLKDAGDDSINYLLKKQNKRLKIAGSFAFAGGYILGFTLSDPQFNESEKAIFIASGLGILGFSVVYGRSRFRFIDQAVMRYNYLISIND